MASSESTREYAETEYAQAIAGEGEYWDNFIAQHLLRGDLPGSIDWRLTFSQFVYNHGWRPFCLGPYAINFRMKEINRVLTRAAPRPGLRVLDLGCGAGWLSLELARRGANVTALDISPTNLALGRYMAETNTRNFPFLYQKFAGLPCRLEEFGSVEYSYADLNTVDLPRSEFDAVVVWDSLHHVAEIERLLEQVRASLKPGGLFLGVDHAAATPRTHLFNEEARPWLEDFCSWVTMNDPEWFYDSVQAAGRNVGLDALAVDYHPAPVEGWKEFSEQLFAEMLDIIRGGLRQEALEKLHARAAEPRHPAGEEEESPFEDVSAERLMTVLTERFRAERFETICPFITPEKTIPHYRNEKERIFQHYLACTLIAAGERAIERGQASGQWFVFELTPERPTQAEIEGASAARQRQSQLETFFEELRTNLADKDDYIARLESELARKNAAISDLEARDRERDAQLRAARSPRLPWKRGK